MVALLLGGAWRFFEREPEHYGWTADDIAGSVSLASAEQGRFAPVGTALAVIALAAIAALAAML